MSKEKDTLQNGSSSFDLKLRRRWQRCDSDSGDSDAEPAEARQLSRHEKYEMDKKAEIEALEQELLKQNHGICWAKLPQTP